MFRASPIVVVSVLSCCFFLLQAGENFENQGGENPPEIFDLRWDRRFYDGTQGFPDRIPWRYNPAGAPPYLEENEILPLYQEAFRTWEAVDEELDTRPLIPRFEYLGEADSGFAEFDGVNTIDWGDPLHPRAFAQASHFYLTRPLQTTTDSSGSTVMFVDNLGTIPFPGPPGTTYPQGTILDADIRIRPDPNFGTASGRILTTMEDYVSVDLPGLMLHEIGHMIGLAHSLVGSNIPGSEQATMALFSQGLGRRSLHDDDVASLLRTYSRVNGLPQTVGGRSLITGRLFSPQASCGAATGVSIRAIRLDLGPDSEADVETFTGSDRRANLAGQPYTGSFQLNVPSGTYALYAKNFETGGAFEAASFNQSTTNSNSLVGEGEVGFLGPLAVVPILEPNLTIDLGDVRLPGCATTPADPVRMSIGNLPKDALHLGEISGRILLALTSQNYRPVGGVTVEISGPPEVRFIDRQGVLANPMRLTTTEFGPLTGFQVQIVEVPSPPQQVEIRVTAGGFSIPLNIPFEPQPLLTAAGVVHAASFIQGPIAPGQIVSVFGSGLGPAESVGASLDAEGRVAASAAGAEVLFDGVPAPVFFARSDQFNVQVPYSVAGKSQVQVQVRYQGRTSSSVTVPVAPTAPGLFALLEDGLRAIVVNQDGSLNGPEHPAQAGQVVVMYGTGEGQTNPPGIDGRLAPYPGPELTHLVRVTIGGADAAITFAGPAPGFAGLLQVNAVVPDGIVFGPRVPLELEIGPASSRRGLVMSVRGVEPFPDFGGTLLQPGVPTPFFFPAIQYELFAGEYSYAVDVPIGIKSLTLTMVPDTPVWDVVFGFRTGRPLESIGDWEQAVRVQPNTPIVIESPVAGRLFIQAFRAFDFGTGLHTSKEILSGKLTVTFE